MDCRLLRVSSRVPVGTSFRTAWASPARVGGWTALKPCSSCEPSAPAATGTNTGAFTSRENTCVTTPRHALLDQVGPTRAAPSERSLSWRTTRLAMSTGVGGSSLACVSIMCSCKGRHVHEIVGLPADTGDPSLGLQVAMPRDDDVVDRGVPGVVEDIRRH